MRGYETSPQVFFAFFSFLFLLLFFICFAFFFSPPPPGRSALSTYQTLKVSGAGAKSGLSSRRRLQVQEAEQFEEAQRIFFFLQKNIFLKKPASPRQATADFFFFASFSYFRSRAFSFLFLLFLFANKTKNSVEERAK